MRFCGTSPRQSAAVADRRGLVPEKRIQQVDESFDAIVVGGGPTGSGTRPRRTWGATWHADRVHLIVGGSNTSPLLVLMYCPFDAIRSRHNTRGLAPFDVPYYWSSVASTSSLHWAYPDVNVAKALGGCGIHNAMQYCTYVDVVLSDGTSSGLIWSDNACVLLVLARTRGSTSLSIGL
ncbi:hypothetical protein PsorP6_018043 [Peronosclerospora sorghi]|uniref:Uncharacterized protein n=2 Tax=Peronosclerospora sorghi TaxID=230839 RepID=A0ACC0WH61_9STRA|nr:hypothetical protein PsorP6_018040 [Peronosclerospora sorghi]KAI9917047.1 hypothetical protein PsorP6_018043 [Peronosclerospora sorghi]